MSRVERKKAENRFKRFSGVCIFIQIIFLICGLLVTDFQIRTMLGIDEASLFSYKQAGKGKYIIHIMGDSYSVDVSTIISQMHNKFAQLRKMAYSIKGRIEQGF
ncbi:MAG TPA: hypothetical protein VFD17_04915 [Clostridia bacterium]|nr:hypothetical protein [Clostridia bacterium]